MVRNEEAATGPGIQNIFNETGFSPGLSRIFIFLAAADGGLGSRDQSLQNSFFYFISDLC
jgi:hypothetical protein